MNKTGSCCSYTNQYLFHSWTLMYVVICRFTLLGPSFQTDLHQHYLASSTSHDRNIKWRWLFLPPSSHTSLTKHLPKHLSPLSIYSLAPHCFSLATSSLLLPSNS
jgi:hypothetical protein